MTRSRSLARSWARSDARACARRASVPISEGAESPELHFSKASKGKSGVRTTKKPEAVTSFCSGASTLMLAWRLDSHQVGVHPCAHQLRSRVSAFDAAGGFDSLGTGRGHQWRARVACQ